MKLLNKPSTEKSPLKVIARLRPPLTGEQISSGGSKVKVTSGTVSLDHGGQQHAFNFDKCYSAGVKSNQIFNENIEALVNKTVLGYNLTLLTMGASGSGKSYTMSGNTEEPGIIPCVSHCLFVNLDKLQKTKDIFITVSFLEVCEGEMIDVLNPHLEQITVKEHPHFGVYVDGLSEFVVTSLDELERYYEQGNRARNIGMLGVKNECSKSSAFFYIHIEVREKGNDLGVKSTIIMADTPGLNCDSEKYGTNPLLNVFKAMDSGSHVPFRDFNETKLLRDSFTGNTITCFVLTLSAAEQDRLNTLVALQNAKIASKNIKNKVSVNLEETVSVMKEIREEIGRLRTTISSNSQNSVDKESVNKMAALVSDLSLVKKSTWSVRASMSEKYAHERKINLANKGILEWVMDLKNLGDKDSKERCLLLQKEKDQLTLEYKERRETVNDMKDELQAKIQDYSKLAESGRATDGETKTKVTLIHELKERLKNYTEKLKELKFKLKQTQEKLSAEKESATGNVSAQSNSAVRRLLEAEERKRMELDDHSMVVDEWERVKLEIQQQKADIQVRVKQGRTYETNEAMDQELELVELKGDKSVVSLQIQILQQEKQRLQKSIDDADKRQSEELEIQQLQHLQVFRQYREVFDQQKISLEQKYVHLVNSSVQDAIFLSTRNEQVTRENQALKQEIAELKDSLSMKG